MLTVSSTECGQLAHTVRSNDLPQKTLRTSREYGPKRQHLPLETHAETVGVQRFARVHGRHRIQSPREPIAVDPMRDPMAGFNPVPSTNEGSILIIEHDHSSSESSSEEVVLQQNSASRVWNSRSEQVSPRSSDRLNNHLSPMFDHRIERWIDGIEDVEGIETYGATSIDTLFSE
jgi:hypothetical protein